MVGQCPDFDPECPICYGPKDRMPYVIMGYLNDMGMRGSHYYDTIHGLLHIYWYDKWEYEWVEVEDWPPLDV